MIFEEIIESLDVNYDERPLASNERRQTALIISTSVTNSDNIVYVPVTNTCKTVRAVLIIVDGS